MPDTVVIHVDQMQPGDTYIGRAVARRGLAASPYANPFRIVESDDRAWAIATFREWVTTSTDPRAVWIREHVHELRGKRLACWCKEATREVACHGDILKEMADAAKVGS